MTRPRTTDGALIVGHGTRDPAGQAEFLAVAAAAAERLAPTFVEPAFLELAEPTIAEGIDRLAARGAGRIAVVPLVLFAAGHAKRDIPEAVATAARRHRQLACRQAPHLGLDERIVELSVRRFHDACAAQHFGRIAERDTLTILVGRGATDAEAQAEFHAFARRRLAACPSGGQATAFAALAAPRLEDALREAAASPFRQIVVQPHLLFGGALADRIAADVATFASRRPERIWRTAAPLGPDDALAEVIESRVRDVLDVP